MRAAAKLVAGIAAGRVPPRILIYIAAAKLNRWFKTGNRRFEFERFYLENPNPWDYLTSPYEHTKYQRTLAKLLEFRSSGESALEIGCSIAVFTGMLADHFQRLTAVDISREALVVAAASSAARRNVRFVQGDIRSLDLGARYDVIVCAELLNYVREKDVRAVCRALDRHLNADGIVVTVGPRRKWRQDPLGFEEWDDALGAHFRQIDECVFEDPSRPYETAVYRRRAEGSSEV